MTRTYVVSGAASGIGQATAHLLRDHGHHVIGIDLHDADVVADLATPEGREAAVREVRARTDVVHGLVPCAGIAGLTGVDPQLVVSVNFFGSIALVRGLHEPLAAAGDAAVVLLSSNSVTCQPPWPLDVAQQCLAEDEAGARAAAAPHDAVLVYPGTKAALAWWARREGVSEAWAGRRHPDERCGTRPDRHPDDRPAAGGPRARGVRRRLSHRPGPAGPTGGGRRDDRLPALRRREPVVGSVLFVDGGTDAMVHPTRPEMMG